MKRRAIIFAAVLACLSAFPGLFFTRNLIDFLVYYAAGQSLISGRSDLYSPTFAYGPLGDYRYPPFFLVAFIPLWVMPYPAAAYLWYLLSVFEIFVCVWVLRQAIKELGPHKSEARTTTRMAWIVSLLVVGQYFVMILHYGNAQLLALTLLFGSFYLARRRKNIMAALLASLAVTIKLMPLLVLPYFALKKQWRFLLWFFVFLPIINLIPATYFGFERNAQLLKAWYQHLTVIVDDEFYAINGPLNLSLKGQLRRYLTCIDYTRRVDGDTQYAAVHLVALSPKQVDQLWMMLASALFACGLTLIWWSSRQAQDNSMSQKAQQEKHAGFQPDGGQENSYFDDAGKYSLLQFGLMICLMLIISPHTSKIYFIALLWPVAFLGHFCLTSKLIKRALIFLAILNLALPLLSRASIQRLLLVIGVDFYVNFILLILLAYTLISNRCGLRMLSNEPKNQAPSVAQEP